MSDTYFPTEVKKRETLNSLIRERWGGSIAPVRDSVEVEDNFYEHEDKNEEPRIVQDIENLVY